MGSAKKAIFEIYCPTNMYYLRRTKKFTVDQKIKKSPDQTTHEIK